MQAAVFALMLATSDVQTMKMILTSTGLKSGLFRNYFLRNLKHAASEAKVIFVPMAAIDDGGEEQALRMHGGLVRSQVSRTKTS
jgi:hypothetical protein